MAQNELDFRPVERCILCSSVKQHPVKGVSWKGTAFSYSHCARCGLKFMSPAPTAASMQRFFREDYWQLNITAQGFPTVAGFDDKTKNQLEFRMTKYKRSYELVRRHLESVRRLETGTRILEVGCAFGFTLEWLNRDLGCQAFGIEPSTEALRRCAEAPAIKVVASTAEEYFVGASAKAQVPQGEKFDVILFRHCLETLIEPRAVLKGVRELLKDDGVLLVYTANVEFYDAMSPFTPFLYSPETLSRLFALEGLDVFRNDSPPSPRDRSTALRILNPSYEMAVFARRGTARETPIPEIDMQALLATISLGNACRGWSQLTPKELVGLLRRNVEKRILRRR